MRTLKVTRRELLTSAAGTCGGAGLVAGFSPAWPLSRAVVSGDPAWLKNIYRELHIDAHFAQVPAPYVAFKPELAAQTFADAGFRMVSCFAGCGGGYSYYPTRIGVVHPGLKRDFTGQMTAALKKRGVRVLAYVAVGSDRRFYKEHSDWMKLRDPAGTGEMRGDVAQMCVNSPWIDHAHIPQLKEIVALYDVDGFFLDGVLSSFVRGACYCKYCRQAFASEVGGEIPVADKDPKVFEHYKWLSRKGAQYAERVIGTLTAIKPELAFVLNHIWVTHNPVKPPAAMTQLVWEPVPPYPGVPSLDFSLEARYLSSLPGIANWSCMTTRGNGWGDYSLRDAAAFRHEAAILLASGGRPYLSDDAYPSGNPDPAVYQVYREVNHRTERLEPFVTGCVPVRDTAVLLSADSMWSKLPLVPPREWMSNPSSPGVAGAHKCLVEGHVQFGILNSDVLVETLGEYKALVLPEQCILSESECAAIRRFVERGGALIATGDTGTRDVGNEPLSDFQLADVLGIRYLGRADTRRAFLRVGADIKEFGVPQMDVQVAGGYSRIQTVSARSLLDLVPSAGPKLVPAEAPEGPGVTLNRFGQGKAVYCAAPLFGAYHQEGTSVLRKLGTWLLNVVHPVAKRSITLENAPLNVEVSYNARSQDRFLHLVNYGGDKRIGGPQQVQDFTTVHGVRVRLQCASRPSRVLLVPENKPIAFEWKNRWCWFQAEPLVLHSVYMIEFPASRAASNAA